MIKVIVVSLLALVVFGVIHTVILEDTWDGFKYRFFLGFFGGIIPFFLGTTLYHFVLKILEGRIRLLSVLIGQMVLAISMSLTGMILFIGADNLLYGTNDSSFFESLKSNIGFAVGAAATISVIYYYVTLFSKKKSN